MELVNSCDEDDIKAIENSIEDTFAEFMVDPSTYTDAKKMILACKTQIERSEPLPRTFQELLDLVRRIN